MKRRFLSYFIVIMLIFNISHVSANAAEVDAKAKEHQKLGALLYGLEGNYPTGIGIPYGEIIPQDYWQIREKAADVYYDKNAGYADYRNACEEVLDLIFNRQFINYDYELQTYQNALKESNDNQWYSDEDWTRFQNSLSALRKALNQTTEDETSLKELTDSFHSLLKAYNLMTNRDYLAGDLNNDGKVTVDDITLLQRYLAEACNLNGAQKMRAAVYSRHCEALEVNDALQLQRYLAEYSEMPIAGSHNNGVVVSEISTNPLISEDFLMERVFNFNICPRNDLILYDIENGYYSTKYFVDEMESAGDLSVFS